MVVAIHSSPSVSMPVHSCDGTDYHNVVCGENVCLQLQRRVVGFSVGCI